MIFQTNWKHTKDSSSNHVAIYIHIMSSFELAVQEALEDISKYEAVAHSIGTTFFKRLMDKFDSVEDAIVWVNDLDKLNNVAEGLQNSIQQWLDHTKMKGSVVSVAMNSNLSTFIGIYSPQWEMVARDAEKLTIH